MKQPIQYFTPDARIIELFNLRPALCTSYNDIVTMNDELEDDALNW